MILTRTRKSPTHFTTQLHSKLTYFNLSENIRMKKEFFVLNFRYTLDVEAVSCDEMYVNLTDVLKETHISVDEFVTHVRDEITAKTQCPCSAGVGANK